MESVPSAMVVLFGSGANAESMAPVTILLGEHEESGVKNSVQVLLPGLGHEVPANLTERIAPVIPAYPPAD